MLRDIVNSKLFKLRGDLAKALAQEFNLDEYKVYQEIDYVLVRTGLYQLLHENDLINADDIDVEIDSYTIRYKGKIL